MQNLSGAALASRLAWWLCEKYPELKANQNFRDLQAQIAVETAENRIAVARKRYVESVQTYNAKVRSFHV